MKSLIFTGIAFFSFSILALGQSLNPIPLTQQWERKMEFLAPDETSFDFEKKKKILIFSLHTGFDHWVRPHTSEMIKIISKKSEAFDVFETKDISMMELQNLSKYDVLFLNNTNSKPEFRNLFVDKLEEITDWDSVAIWSKAKELEQNISQYVQNGGGLFLIHGANTTFNNSMEFSSLTGGSFDYHTPQQKFQVRLADPNHPLVQAFPTEGFAHVDEPYFYKNAYEKMDFKPLLYFRNEEITNQRKGQELKEGITYVAWIRKSGKGRVMYCAASHNAQSFENPDLLRFYLDGLQYVAGDVQVDETPIGK